MHDHQPLNARTIRSGLIEFMNSQSYTHALTLNSDRELSVTRIRSIFSTFCVSIVREMLGKQRVGAVSSDDRLNAIAFPEHLESNAHLHALADFSCFIGRGFDHNRLTTLVYKTWRCSTHEAGSIDLGPIRSQGYPRYITKLACGRDPLYFLARDFHPHR